MQNDTYAKNSQKGVVKTYMSVVIELVVGQLELVETDNLLHPLGPSCRRVRVKVNSKKNAQIGASTLCQNAESPNDIFPTNVISFCFKLCKFTFHSDFVKT